MQDCEINAAKRWLDHNLTRYQHLRPVYLGDDLYSRQPLCQTLIKRDAEFLLGGAKPASHTTVYDYLNGLNLPSKTVTQRRPGGKTETRHYRWASHMPLNDTSNPLHVNWLLIEIVRKLDGKVAYRNSFITNLAVNRDNVEQLAACGTAQWKIENESFNLFKNNGYQLQYNFVHEHQSLSNLLLTLNLLAFTFHTTCDQLCELWHTTRTSFSRRHRFFVTLDINQQLHRLSRLAGVAHRHHQPTVSPP